MSVLLLAGTAAAAAKRCDWHGPKSKGEATYKKCVDFVALNGTTLDLPGNVTRISADGISLCQTATPQTGTGNADIVFIYDNSRSMTATGAYIDPVTKDTSFYFMNDQTCADNLIKPTKTMTYPSKEGGNVTVDMLSKTTGCDGNVAGDPYNARGAIIRTAIDFLASTSPTSTAGAMSFSGDVNYLQTPVMMNDVGNITRIKNSIQLDKTGSTDYRHPLDKAKQWLNNPALIKTSKQAIVFISDGAPSQNPFDPYMDLVDAKMPPIFSIFLSKAVTNDTANLKDLSDRTGGTFNRVNPNDPIAMETILKTVVSTITKNTLPKAVSVTNKSMSPPQSSSSQGVTANPDGSAGILLDSIIGLKSGSNSIELKVTKDDNTVVTYAFTMNVAGTDLTASTDIYSCYDMPTLTATDAAGKIPEIYRPDATGYTLNLTRSPSELRGVSVLAVSDNGDKENVALGNPNSALGFPAQSGDFKLNPKDPSPSVGNGIVEIDNAGDLTFTWTHPRDARETVTYLLPGKIIPVLDGSVLVHIKDPVTTGVTFDPVKLKDPVVIVDDKDKCLVNCQGTQIYWTNPAVPTWVITVKSPISYSVKVFDNLGQFVSAGSGEITEAAWNSLAKSGDSAVIQLKIPPVSESGQQLGTGAYLMKADITALGNLVTKNSAGDNIVVRNSKQQYFKRFGYVRH